MHIVATGISHKTAPVEIREKVTFPETVMAMALEDLLASPHISEACILSTCNRVELYTVSTDMQKGKEEVAQFISKYHDIPIKDLSPYLYYHEAIHAVHHLFRVTSSLDSMVVGEAQIQGQVKDAYAQAFEADATSIVLNKLFRHAISVGKMVRTDTDIGESAVSISYAAVELAKKVFEELEDRSALILGAGEMSELTAKHLLANGVSSIFVANRTYERAVELANKFCGKALNYESLEDHLEISDIIITSTGAPHYVIKRDAVQRAMANRNNRPLFLIDIAVPRDVDPSVGSLYNVYLYNIDDLANVVESNLSERKVESKKAEVIISEEVEEFVSWYNAMSVVPTIAQLKQHAERIRKSEIESMIGKLSDLSDKDKNAINALTCTIVNKLLHDPIVKMKKTASEKDGYLYVDSVRFLFGLEEDERNDKIDGPEMKTVPVNTPLNIRPKPNI